MGKLGLTKIQQSFNKLFLITKPPPAGMSIIFVIRNVDAIYNKEVWGYLSCRSFTNKFTIRQFFTQKSNDCLIHKCSP